MAIARNSSSKSKATTGKSRPATTIRAGSLIPRTQVARPKATAIKGKATSTGRAALSRGNRTATTIRASSGNSGG